jgi:hypothetical protein
MAYRDVVNSVNKRYTKLSERLIFSYEKAFGLPCDLYFPIHDEYNEYTMYRDMKIFGPHQSFTYKELPDVRHTHFYIPYLIPKDAMNSSELEFSSFYNEDNVERPFIETSKKRELPIGTKVVVFQGESMLKFFIDKKLVVTGANGFMLLRMYLDPLAKDSDDDNITEDQEENVDDYDEEEDCCDCDCGEENQIVISGTPMAYDELSDTDLFMQLPDEDE